MEQNKPDLNFIQKVFITGASIEATIESSFGNSINCWKLERKYKKQEVSAKCLKSYDVWAAERTKQHDDIMESLKK